jgi:hypothetical protein
MEFLVVKNKLFLFYNHSFNKLYSLYKNRFIFLVGVLIKGSICSINLIILEKEDTLEFISTFKVSNSSIVLETLYFFRTLSKHS